MIPVEDTFATAALRALPPPPGMRLLTGGEDGPGAAEAQALATLAVLTLLSPKVRSPLQLAAAALRVGGGALDEARLLAAAVGGCLRITSGLDGPVAERIDAAAAGGLAGRRVRGDGLRVAVFAR